MPRATTGGSRSKRRRAGAGRRGVVGVRPYLVMPARVAWNVIAGFAIETR